MQDSSHRGFKLLGSVPHEMGSSYAYGGARMQSHDVDASAETVAAASSPPAGGKMCSGHMGPSGSTKKVSGVHVRPFLCRWRQGCILSGRSIMICLDIR